MHVTPLLYTSASCPILLLSQSAATAVKGLLQARVGGRPYSERMLGQVVCMTQWMQEQRAELGLSDKGDTAPCGARRAISILDLLCAVKTDTCTTHLRTFAGAP